MIDTVVYDYDIGLGQTATVYGVYSKCNASRGRNTGLGCFGPICMWFVIFMHFIFDIYIFLFKFGQACIRRWVVNVLPAFSCPRT